MEDRHLRIRTMLVEKKRELWNNLRSDLFATQGEELHRQFDLALDPEEAGLVGVLEDTGLGVADVRRQELTALDEALGRLERGTYGICEACGEEIPEDRLRVMPFARYCVEDQEKAEGENVPKAKL